MFVGYNGGPLLTPLARIQAARKDMMMSPDEALTYLGGARFENYSGQIIAEHTNKNQDFILCDLTCTCSEVGSKNADEYGEVLVILLNSVEKLLAQEAMLTRLIAEVCDHNEVLRGALERIMANQHTPFHIHGIAQDALNAIKPVDME